MHCSGKKCLLGVFCYDAYKRRKNIRMIWGELVIKHHLDRNSERVIAHKVLIPRTSVHYIIVKYRSTKCIANIINRSRKRKATVHVDRCIQRKIMANHRISSSQIKAELQSAINVAILE